MKSPTAKAFLITTVFFACCLIIPVAIVMMTESASHIASFKHHIFDADIWLHYAPPLLTMYFITVALLEWSFKRKIRKERDEQDRLEQKQTQAKMNKVLDIQMAELERKQKELEERERKLKEQERYMPK